MKTPHPRSPLAALLVAACARSRYPARQVTIFGVSRDSEASHRTSDVDPGVHADEVLGAAATEKSP